jgi:hypothetical protein
MPIKGKSHIEAVINSLPKENVKALNDAGFPNEVIPAFLETASEMDTILMSRDPGFAGGQLISEGYDLKGFHIKSKSCNWGPMAGFVCKLPMFNKSGIEKYEYNVKNTSHYLEELNKKTKEEQDLIPDAWERSNPWEHIKISESRRNNLFSNEELWTSLLRNKQGEPPIEIALKEEIIGYYGISGDKSDSVRMEYILKKEQPIQGNECLWGLYHGGIQIRDESPNSEKKIKYRFYEFQEDNFILTEKLTNNKNNYLTGITEKGPKISWDNFPDINELRTKTINNPFNKRPDEFFELQAITNPYPPNKRIQFEDGTRSIITIQGRPSFKNCVTGDFDLFAFWPINIKEELLVRDIEKQFYNQNKHFSVSLKSVLNKSIQKSEELQSFIKNRNQQIAQYGTPSYNMYLKFDNKSEDSTIDRKEFIHIEFIPVNGELLKSENIHFGNIHEFGHRVAQTLNSLASFNFGFTSNLALHSDEGGRPFINEVDFPIGYFLPKKMKNDLPFGQCGILKDMNDFLDFILYVNHLEIDEESFNVYLNQGWFLDLILNALNLNELKNLLNTLNSTLQAKGMSSNLYCTDIKEKIETEITKFGKRKSSNIYRKKFVEEFLGFKAPMDTQYFASDACLQKLAEHTISILVDVNLLKNTDLNKIITNFGVYNHDKSDFSIALSKTESI